MPVKSASAQLVEADAARSGATGVEGLHHRALLRRYETADLRSDDAQRVVDAGGSERAAVAAPTNTPEVPCR